MDHGSGDKTQAAAAQGQYGTFADHQTALRVLRAEEIAHHYKGLLGSHDHCVGIGIHEQSDIGGMIRFHMVHDQIVRHPAVQNLVESIQPFPAEVSVYRIQYGDLFIQNDIGVICHAPGNGILAFEQIDLPVIYAHIPDILSQNILYQLHSAFQKHFFFITLHVHILRCLFAPSIQ